MQDTIFQVRMVPYSAIIRKYDRDMKLRYNYRLYPTRGQRSALRIRAEAYEAGLPYITDADLSARLTAHQYRTCI
jgi:putative transposase